MYSALKIISITQAYNSSHNNIDILRATIVDSNSLILNGSKINFALYVLMATSQICLSAHDINYKLYKFGSSLDIVYHMPSSKFRKGLYFIVHY